jgi:hypothetical protein
MKNVGKAIFGFAIVSVMVLGAYFANSAVAGGGKSITDGPGLLYYLALFRQQEAPPAPTLFDLQRQNDIP